MKAERDVSSIKVKLILFYDTKSHRLLICFYVDCDLFVLFTLIVSNTLLFSFLSPLSFLFLSSFFPLSLFLPSSLYPCPRSSNYISWYYPMIFQTFSFREMEWLSRVIWVSPLTSFPMEHLRSWGCRMVKAWKGGGTLTLCPHLPTWTSPEMTVLCGLCHSVS